MSRQAALAFIEASDSDPALKRALEGAWGPGPLREVAQAHGYGFTHEEIYPFMEMLRFLHDAQRDPDLREGLRQAGNDASLVDFARRRGYHFSLDELSHLSMEAPTERPLSDEELGAVAGGTVAATGDGSGLSVNLQGTRQRTSTGMSFSETLAKSLDSAAGLTMSAGSLVAPFVPGGSVLSAAMGGTGGEPFSRRTGS